MKDLIKSRLDHLKKKTFFDLSCLPTSQEEKMKLNNGKSITLTTWKDSLDDGSLKIVIQAYRYLFLGFGRMEAEGFIINDAGEIHTLERKDIYEFL